MRPLTPKQLMFVAEYQIDLNATRAAIRAGYSKKNADKIGAQLLGKKGVKAAVAKASARRIQRADLTADRVLEEMRRLAFMDIRQLFDDQGNLRAIHELDEQDAAAIAGIEVIIKNAEAGDGKTDKVHKVKLTDKTRALEMLGKHFKLLSDHVSVTLDDVLIEKLHAGRKRAAAAKGK